MLGAGAKPVTMVLAVELNESAHRAALVGVTVTAHHLFRFTWATLMNLEVLDLWPHVAFAATAGFLGVLAVRRVLASYGAMEQLHVREGHHALHAQAVE